jgi:hypothetical protein
MPVEVLACPVVAHRGARVGVPGRDLHIPEVDASVEHRRHERVAEHVRMGAASSDSGIVTMSQSVWRAFA